MRIKPSRLSSSSAFLQKIRMTRSAIFGNFPSQTSHVSSQPHLTLKAKIPPPPPPPKKKKKKKTARLLVYFEDYFHRTQGIQKQSAYMDSTISSLDEKLKTSSKKRKIEGDDEFNSDAPTPAKKYLVNTTATITAPCKLVPKRFDAGKSKSVPVASKSEVSLNSCMSPVHYGSSIEKIEGDLFGKNDRADRHIDRIFSSYNQRRKNEFNDFMKPEDIAQ
ncbi:hypothetical protein OROMI_007275 [Orobanche minor]